MTTPRKLSPGTVLKTIRVCIQNGERFLAESYDLQFREPLSSRFYLIMTAQEEFAKAFLMFLVKEGIVRLNQAVLRSINDHACKQLVGIIMDYMIMHWDDIEELEAAIESDLDLGDRLPSDVASAMNLLRHEKIGRWESGSWEWAEKPSYDPSALRIAEGKKDRRKQDALYVRVGRDGQVCSTPWTIIEQETEKEFERAERFNRFVGSMMNATTSSGRYADGTAALHRYKKAIAALTLLFEKQPRK
jgi:hypothetical protein